MVKIVSSVSEFPPHYYTQSQILEAARLVWNEGSAASSLERWFERVGVEGRFFSLPLEQYAEISGFGQANAQWCKSALGLGKKTLQALFGRAEMDASDISLMAFSTVTGIAIPSIDAQLMNQMPFRAELKRMPLFGFGCASCVAGVSRVGE
ncbi:MAG: hypothetical protein IPJ88_05495 [Myxococcales bacterium]|nr:MAG: hypothetical protein IPJ88_05495 [Myxococcales bacterium]